MMKLETKISTKLLPWLSRWGFSLLVLLAAAAAAYVAYRVGIPRNPPGIALKSAAVHRIEVGAAAFAGLYLVAMAFVLALHNRGFSEIGVNGLKAQDMANKSQQEAIESHEEGIEIVKGTIREIEQSVEKSVRDLEERVQRVEKAAKRASARN